MYREKSYFSLGNHLVGHTGHTMRYFLVFKFEKNSNNPFMDLESQIWQYNFFLVKKSNFFSMWSYHIFTLKITSCYTLAWIWNLLTKTKIKLNNISTTRCCKLEMCMFDYFREVFHSDLSVPHEKESVNIINVRINKNRGFIRLSIAKKQKHNWLTQYIFRKIMPSSGVIIDWFTIDLCFFNDT
jgi:hypothetical protein